MSHSTSRLATLAGVAALLGACASSPPRPTEAIARAESSYEQADQAGGRRYDPANLDLARDKLAQAKAAADKGRMKEADRLAEQAEVDAELAAARARSATAQTAAQELRASLSTLRDETQRQPAAGAAQ